MPNYLNSTALNTDVSFYLVMWRRQPAVKFGETLCLDSQAGRNEIDRRTLLAEVVWPMKGPSCAGHRLTWLCAIHTLNLAA
jgi:hypothetical protein